MVLLLLTIMMMIINVIIIIFIVADVVTVEAFVIIVESCKPISTLCNYKFLWNHLHVDSHKLKQYCLFPEIIWSGIKSVTIINKLIKNTLHIWLGGIESNNYLINNKYIYKYIFISCLIISIFIIIYIFKTSENLARKNK